MPRDASGNYTLPPGNPVVPGTVIEADWANPTMADIAAALSDSLSRTGSGGMLVAFKNADGTMLAPGLSWVNEPTSGWYRAALNDFWYSVGNENIFRITKTGIELAAGKVAANISSFTAVQDDEPAPMKQGQQWYESDTGGFYMRYVNPDLTETLISLGATGGDFIPFEEKGAPNGVATLGPDGKLTPAQLPPLPESAIIPSGTIFDYAGSAVVPSGWLICNGAAISRTTFAALFAAIGTTWGAGDGSTTFNIPNLLGRFALGSDGHQKLASGNDAQVSVGGSNFTVPSNVETWITGTPVLYTANGGTITPLVSGTTYYVIRQSATTLLLATSLANAQNGVFITLTAVTPGMTWSLGYASPLRPLGSYGGNETHAMTASELLAHTHTIPMQTTTYEFASPVGNNGVRGQSSTATSSAGGNAAMNIMNPYAAVVKMIKT